MEFDHILVIGFGGPTRPEEVLPFLKVVTKGSNVPEERLAQVAKHYEATGGSSPYNEHTFRLVEKLKKSLKADGVMLPVFTGMRNWHPFLAETLAGIKQRGFVKGIGVILAPHRSQASFDRYVRSVDEAIAETGAAGLKFDYLKPWHTHPLFIQAQADRVRGTLDTLDPGQKEGAHLLFCAHSIPVEMARASHYAEEFRESSERVAKELNHSGWSIAYQSRSGPPTQPWLEPDILSVIRGLKQKGWRAVVPVPIGFLSDHTEVLYDLDIEAQREARAAEIGFRRAPTVMDHPKFVEMLTALIRERVLGN
jgi:ferrochelatase